MLRSEVRLLFWKEVRQLTRNTGAMLSSLLLPAMLVVLAPVLAVLASTAGGYQHVSVRPPTRPLPGLQFGTPLDFFLLVMLPALFVVASLLAPMLAAVQTLIMERERRSLELLLALPVVVGDVLTAKLVANLATAVATILPMFVVDAVVILALTPAGAMYVAGALFLVVSTILTSAAASLLMALLARDLRTATTLAGTLTVPPLLLTGLCLVLVPGLARFVVLGLLMLAMGIGTLVGAVRGLTYERYVS